MVARFAGRCSDSDNEPQRSIECWSEEHELHARAAFFLCFDVWTKPSAVVLSHVVSEIYAFIYNLRYPRDCVGGVGIIYCRSAVESCNVVRRRRLAPGVGLSRQAYLRLQCVFGSVVLGGTFSTQAACSVVGAGSSAAHARA